MMYTSLLSDFQRKHDQYIKKFIDKATGFLYSVFRRHRWHPEIDWTNQIAWLKHIDQSQANKDFISEVVHKETKFGSVQPWSLEARPNQSQFCLDTWSLLGMFCMNLLQSSFSSLILLHSSEMILLSSSHEHLPYLHCYHTLQMPILQIWKVS